MAVTFQQLVDKVITDHTFRKQFETDRVAAVKSLGVNVTPQLCEALEALNLQQIKAVAITMGGPEAFT